MCFICGLEPKIKIIEEEDNIQGQFHLWASHQERKPQDRWTKEFFFLPYLHTKWSRLKTHMKSHVNHRHLEIGAALTGKQNFFVEFNSFKYLFQLG